MLGGIGDRPKRWRDSHTHARPLPDSGILVFLKQIIRDEDGL